MLDDVHVDKKMNMSFVVKREPHPHYSEGNIFWERKYKRKTRLTY